MVEAQFYCLILGPVRFVVELEYAKFTPEQRAYGPSRGFRVEPKDLTFIFDTSIRRLTLGFDHKMKSSQITSPHLPTRASLSQDEATERERERVITNLLIST